MKLSATQLPNVEKQIGVKAVSEEDPIMPNLHEAFGEHTFFLDAAGLNIVEPTPRPDSAEGCVVNVAKWTNDERTELKIHEPEVLRVSLELNAEEHGSDT